MPEAPVKASAMVFAAAIASFYRQSKLAVTGQDLVAPYKRLRKALDEIDRAMLSTRTADRYRQVIAIVARVIGKPAGDEMIDVAVHALDFGMALEIGDDGGILARAVREGGLVVRVGQTTHVENEIGIERDAVLVTERLE